MNVNNFKTLIRLCLAVGVLFLLPRSLQATHIVGGDMEYDIVSVDNVNNTVTVNLRMAVYRDCFFGDPTVYFDDPAHIGIFNQANQLIQDWEVDFVGTDDTLQQGLDSFCLVNLQPVCVHRTFYAGTVTLPIIDGGYTFAYQRCCRNQTISNIIDPLRTGATFLIRLRDEAIAAANNSPEFKTWPPIYICANEPLAFDHGATDVDNDSLVYKLCTPFDGGTIGDPQPIPTDPPPYDTVVWVSGFSLDNILGTGVPLTIDPQTGIMRAVPGTLGQYVVGVCVEEYDRATGELLSIVRRDFQYNVNPCDNIEAVFDAPDAQCDDFSVVFDNNSVGGNGNFEWYANGELFSTDNDGQIIELFPDTGNYTVELVAVPNTICADTFSQTIFLQRNSIIPDFFQAVIGCVDSAIIDVTDLSLDTVSTIESYEWIAEYNGIMDTLSGENAAFIVPLGVSGTITLNVRNVNGCDESFTRDFDTDLPNPTDFILAERTVCEGETVALNPFAPEGLDFQYVWAPANLLDDATAQNPVATLTETTTFSVTITNGTANCETVLNTTITVNDRPTADFSTVEECGGVTYVFTNTSDIGTTFFYDFGVAAVNSDTSILENPTFTFPGSGTYPVTFVVTSAEGCSDTLVRDIVVEVDSPIELMIDENIMSCEPQVTLAPTAAVPVTYTYFDVDGNILGSGPTLVVNVSGVTVITVVATDGDGCTEERNVTITGGPADISAPDTVLNCGLAGINFNVTNDDPTDVLTYVWTPANIFDPTTTNSPNPTFIGAFGEYDVTVTATNQFNCSTTENITLIVLDDAATFSFTSQPECDGLTVNFMNTSTADFGYLWDFDGLGTSNETNPSFTFPAEGTYTVTLSSVYGNDCLTPFSREIVVSETVVEASFALDPLAGTCEVQGITLDFIDASINQSSSPISYAWTFSSGTPSSATTQNVSVLITESTQLTATLTITSETGCVDDTTVVFDIELPEVNLPEDVTICPGDSVNLNPGFDADLTYTWTPVNGFDPNDPNPRVGEGGTYIVTATTSAGDLSCPATDTIVVTVADEIELVLIGPDGPIGRDSIANGGNGNGDESDDPDLPFLQTCGEPTELTADVMANIDVVFTSPDGTVLGNGTTITVDPLVRDTVIATATDEFGCMVSDTVVILNRQVDVAPDANGQDITLCETQDTMVGLVNLDPDDILTFAWTPNAIINGPLDGPSVDITPVMEGTETLMVTVTNQYGCDTVVNFTVTIQPFDPNDFPTPVEACYAEPTPLNPGGQPVPGYTYEWSPMDGDFSNPANPIVTLTENTTYTVVITDPLTNCTETQMVEVIVAPEIAFMAMPTDSTLCEAGSVTYTSTNAVGAIVTWYSDPARTMVLVVADDVTLTVTTPGETVTAYGQAVDPVTGCTEELEVTLNYAPFTPNDFPETVDACFEEPTVIPGGAAVEGYTYEWDPMDGDFSDPANPVVTLSDTTMYTVIITDPITGCADTQMVTVNVAPEIGFESLTQPTDSTICLPDTVTFITTNLVNAEVTWYSDPALTMVLATGESIDLTLNTPGMITAYGQAVDPVSGCTEELNVSLTLLDFDPPTYPDTVRTCFNEAVVIGGGIDDGGLTYEWTPMDGDFSDPANPVVTLTETTEFMLTVSDPASGCSALDTVVVVVAPEIMFESETQPTDSVICEPGSVTFMTTNAVNADVTWYTDSDRTMVFSTGDDVTIMIDEPGTITLYGQAVDPETGCTEELEVSVTLQPFMPNEYPEVVVACYNEPTPIPGGPAVPGYEYEWDPMDGDFNDPANPIVTLTETTTYTVTITDMMTMCSSEQEIEVQVADEIQLEATPQDTTLCMPGTYTVTATTAITTDITWYSDAALTMEIGTGPTIEITATVPNETVTVYGVATDPETGCTEQITVTGVYDPLDDGLPAETVFGCVGDDPGPSLFPSGTNPDYTYTYDPASAVDLSDPTDPTWVGDASGTVDVTVLDPVTGCEVTVTVMVTMTDLTNLTGMADPETIILGESSTLTVNGCEDCDYDWMPPNGTIDPNGNASTTATPSEEGELVYEVLVTKDGCSEIVEIELTVIDVLCTVERVFLPNAFSPNNDGDNDELRLRSRFLDQLEEYELMIFNRWGQQMFRSFDQFEAWDGRFEGEELEPDVYGFYLRVVCPDGQELVQKGNITLLR